jgi:invasion protein IalB
MLTALPKVMTVSVRDDAAKPLVSMRMADTEVRYAQFRIEQPAKSSDMICDGVDCTVSFADARAIIDGMKAGRQAAIHLFTNNGQVAQVRLSAVGFAEAIARTRPNP